MFIDGKTGREINMTYVAQQFNINDSALISGSHNMLALKSPDAFAMPELPVSIDEKIFAQMLDMLRNFLASEQADNLKVKDSRMLQAEIDETHELGHEKGWEKLRRFLSDDANAVTLASPIRTYVSQHPETPMKVRLLFSQ
jgi:hypothetical protein